MVMCVFFVCLVKVPHLKLSKNEGLGEKSLMAPLWFFSLFSASIINLGALTGAIGGGLQSGYIGRKCSLMIDAIVFMIATIGMTFAPNLIVILIARFIQGWDERFGRFDTISKN